VSAKDEDFLAQLRAVFNVEAAEHVQAMVTGLMQIERPSTPSARGEAVSVVFRAAHSLKGAARAIGLRDVESLCHSLEDLFAGWKRQDSPPTPAEIDDAHRSLTAVSAALALSMPAAQMSKKLGNVPSVPDRSSGGPVARAAPAGGKAAGRTEATSAAAERGSPSPGDTVRIAVSKLDEMLVQAEELFAAKLAAMRHVEEMRELEQRFDTWKHEWAEVESDAQTLRQLVARPMAAGVGQANDRALGRLLDFADWSSDYLKSIERHTASLARSADQDRHVIDRLVDDLLESSKNVLLLPFATSAAPFPKLVRDLCRDQGKDAELGRHDRQAHPGGDQGPADPSAAQRGRSRHRIARASRRRSQAAARQHHDQRDAGRGQQSRGHGVGRRRRDRPGEAQDLCNPARPPPAG
jgi:two-component system chemotaxis sensor kinase CheA